MSQFQTYENGAEMWREMSAAMVCRNFFQTWEYGSVHSEARFRSVDRVALSEGGEPVVMAQLRIKRIPVLGVGVAEVDYGPMWSPASTAQLAARLTAFFSALRTRYCNELGLDIRVRPRSAFDPTVDHIVKSALAETGFVCNEEVWKYQTLVIDLSIGREAISRGFTKSWRYELRRSARAGIDVVMGSGSELFDRFKRIYEHMWSRKRFQTGIRIPLVKEVNERLPETDRALISIATKDERDIAATVCLTIGDAVQYYLGCSDLDLRGSLSPGYLLQWANIGQAIELGSRWYDTGGLLGHGDTGVNRFKRGMGGTFVQFPGQFDAGSDRPATKLYNVSEQCVRVMRRTMKRCRA